MSFLAAKAKNTISYCLQRPNQTKLNCRQGGLRNLSHNGSAAPDIHTLNTFIEGLYVKWAGLWHLVYLQSCETIIINRIYLFLMLFIYF